MAGPLRRGGGVRAGSLRKKIIFFFNLFFQRSNVQTAIKLEGGGGLGLYSPAIKRRTFLVNIESILFLQYFI